MTTNLAPQEAGTRYTHKATGIIWRYAIDSHVSAPFTLQLRNPRRRSPATSHRFTTAGNRDKYVARCIANAHRIDRHVSANFYPTPPEATRALLSVETFDGPIWEPACGKGHIAKVLEAQGHEVIATDLNDWGYGTPRIDFLKAHAGNANARHIVTNPPYGKGLADAFVNKALAITAKTGGKVAMLLNLASLAQEQRTPAWRKNSLPPDRVGECSVSVRQQRASCRHSLAQSQVLEWPICHKTAPHIYPNEPVNAEGIACRNIGHIFQGRTILRGATRAANLSSSAEMDGPSVDRHDEARE